MSNFFPFIPLVIIVGVLLAILVSYFKYQRYRISRQSEEVTNELPETLVLKRPFAHYPEKHLRKFQLILVLSFVLLVVTFFSVLLLNVDSIDAYLEKLQSLFSNDFQLIFMFLVMLLFTVVYPLYLHRSARNEKLVLTKEGISYHPPRIFFIDHFFPAWSLRWENIASASMDNIGVQSRLYLEDVQGHKRLLMINQWRELRENDKDRPTLFSEIWEASELVKNPDAIQDRALLCYIKKYTALDLVSAKSDLNFDLLSNQKIKLVLIVMTVTGGYALIDALLNMETYLITPPLWWFIAGGITGSLFSFVKIADKDIPISNTIGVSLIFGIVIGVALYPGLLRINQLTDPYGIKNYEYSMDADGVFRNSDYALPDIRMESDKYWRNIKTGQSYTFKLRKGGLGFYQIDMDDVYTKMRKWYCSQEPDNKNNIKIGCD